MTGAARVARFGILTLALGSTRPLLAEIAGATDIGGGASVRPLKPGFWLHVSSDANGIAANALVAQVGKLVVLVDTPWTDAQTECLLGWAEHNVGRITLAVVTHSHADRMGGIGALKAHAIRTLASGLTVEQARLEQKPLPEAVISADKPVYRDPRGFEIFYPGSGHTSDNSVVWFPAARLLHGGCLVKSVDAEGMGYVKEADLERWLVAIQALRARYAAAEVVVPGHGAVAGAAALERTLELIRAYRAKPEPDVR